MKNYQFVVAFLVSLFIYSTPAFAQPLKSLKDRYKVEQHGSNKNGGVSTKGPKANPSIIQSLVSTSAGMQLKFTVADRNTTRILVYRKSKEEGPFILVKSIKPNNRFLSHSFVDPSRNLKQGQEYCYLVRTWLQGQVIGTPSKGQSKCYFFDGGFKAPDRPGNPTRLKVDRVNSNSVTISFLDQSENEEYFLLERKEPHHKDWVVTAVESRSGSDRTGKRKVAIKNTSLEMEQNYQYRVRAVNKQGSSLSNAIQVKTYPIETKNANIRISHPSTNTLQVAWDYEGTDKPNWEVYLYDHSSDQKIKTNQVRANQKRMTAFNNLDPSKLYCIGLRKLGANGMGYPRVCDSPFAKRTAKNHNSPVVSQIRSVKRGRKGELIVDLSFGQEGQLLDLIDVKNGQRKTIDYYRNGNKNFPVVALREGRKYCIRMFTTNAYGTRYSNSVCQSTKMYPPRDLNVREISEDHVIKMGWSSFGADEHTFEYSGQKSGAPDHKGSIKMDIPYNWIEFQAKAGYSYCFKVRSKNEFETTEWSSRLCGVISEEKEERISYAADLDAIIPSAGNVIYLHEVRPGTKARLSKVSIAGNTFTPYIVQFLPMNKNREHCGTDIGVFIEPGKDLTGQDLHTLYGENEPKTPIVLKACKLKRYNDRPIDLSKDIPVQIDYIKNK